MKLDDMRLMTVAAMTRYPSIREALAFKLNTEMFSDTKHQIMSEALQKAKTQAELIELSTMAGGRAYCSHLVKVSKRVGRVSMSDVNRWIAEMADDMKRKQVEVLIDTAQEQIAELEDLSQTDGLVAQLVDGLVETQRPEMGSDGGFVSLEGFADDLIADILDLNQGIVRNKRQTYFDSLDQFLLGGFPNEVTTIGGIPGIGKTQLAIQIAAQRAAYCRWAMTSSRGKTNPGIVAVISAEMRKEDLLMRLAQCYTGVPVVPGMSSRDTAKVLAWISRNRDLPILVDDSPVPSYSRLEALYTRYGKIDFIVGDFAELMAGGFREEFGSREQQVAKVFVTGKILGKRYNCPFVIITQLNRALGSTKSKVPSMNDIRYTGMGEAVSALVLLLYYPYDYILKGEQVSPPMTMPAERNVAYNIAAKHRWGPTGPIAVGWIPEITRWEDQPSSGMYHKVDGREVWQR